MIEYRKFWMGFKIKEYWRDVCLSVIGIIYHSN